MSMQIWSKPWVTPWLQSQRSTAWRRGRQIWLTSSNTCGRHNTSLVSWMFPLCEWAMQTVFQTHICTKIRRKFELFYCDTLLHWQLHSVIIGALHLHKQALQNCFLHANKNESSQLRIMHSHIFCRFFSFFFFFAIAAMCCVCMSPLPSLNQEGRSEKRLRSTTSVFLLCVCETPDGCLSCSHANAAREPWQRQVSHAEGGSESLRWGSYRFFDGHRRGFMRNTMTRLLCWADGQPLWECHLYIDDGGATCDQGPRLGVWTSPACELKVVITVTRAHIRWRNTFFQQQRCAAW